MSFCTSLRNFIQIVPTLAEKMTSCRFSRWRISAILDFRDLIMGNRRRLRGGDGGNRPRSQNSAGATPPRSLERSPPWITGAMPAMMKMFIFYQTPNEYRPKSTVNVFRLLLSLLLPSMIKLKSQSWNPTKSHCILSFTYFLLVDL